MQTVGLTGVDSDGRLNTDSCRSHGSSSDGKTARRQDGKTARRQERE
jgi:hypothetical protein